MKNNFFNVLKWWSTLTPTTKLQSVLLVSAVCAVVAFYNQIEKREQADALRFNECNEEKKKIQEKKERLENEFRNYIINDIKNIDNIKKSIDSLKIN
jgi:hypothetical protein